MPSTFLNPSSRSKPEDPAVLHLRRDLLTTTVLRYDDDENLGYKEGKVANTRFGSFPHSTLIGQPWGSQITASKVDTGSRGRRPKRKADELGEDNETETLSPKAATAASSGFLHLLYPTPETWTASLPHRTQVVYTPDYSYILHRLCTRPGNTVIEAGAGSGSFTHAAVRAVFNGYPEMDPEPEPPTKRLRRRFGRVCSFEFHEQRVERLREEIQQHGFDGLVEVTHRDVYEDGFLLPNSVSPKANAVFLDLPAPWLALKHLVRNPTNGQESPLDPNSPVHVCAFSPCLEQAQRTISTLRQMSWLSISMVEVNHRGIDARRERVGLDTAGMRGAVVFPKSVDEAVDRMRLIEERVRRFRESQAQADGDGNCTPVAVKEETDEQSLAEDADPASVTGRKQVPAFTTGRVIHRSEPDLRLHTSYLVFAILPQEWRDEDEKRCRQIWPSQQVDESEQKQKSKRQIKRESKAKGAEPREGEGITSAGRK